jgi:acetolactate synthase regulatory subunit
MYYWNHQLKRPEAYSLKSEAKNIETKKIFMKQEFTLEIAADNNFSILNRIVNVLNRRRVRIKKLIATENEEDFTRGGAILLIYTTADMMEKVKHQLEKCIEIENASYYEGSDRYFLLSERTNKQVA